MILDIIASMVLAYFLLRECLYVRTSWRDGHAPGWIVVGGLIALTLLLPLGAVWA